MVAEEVIITLSGGAPWGFRLQGGVEHQKPLQVAKVRQVNATAFGSEIYCMRCVLGERVRLRCEFKPRASYFVWRKSSS